MNNDRMKDQKPLIEFNAGETGPSITLLYDKRTKSLNLCVIDRDEGAAAFFTGTPEHFDILCRQLAHLKECPACNANPLTH